MEKTETKKVPTNDRQMSAKARASKEGEIFFFPKRNPPISVRATSLDEAEKILEATNNKEV